MRRYDVAYVQNPPHYTKPKDYKEMDLKELKKTHIDTCAKSGGLVGNCMNCKNQCVYGKQAVMLTQGKTEDDSLPLYDGKTLIEKAREENMKRKQQQVVVVKSKDNKRTYIDNWYELAMASGEPVAWIMENYKVTKEKAQKKLYSWRSLHKLSNPPVQVKTIEATSLTTNLAAKVKELQEKQDQVKKEMQETLNKHNALKEQYDAYSNQIFTLLSAMDIIKE